jgi:hypothetical protein
MRLLSKIFFYGYVLLLIMAGCWGIFSARWDHRVLFHMNIEVLEPKVAASLLSQYRFLRAIELGFGLFSLRFRNEIFEKRTFNRLFLAGMSLGVVARLVSLIMDGSPHPIFYFFLLYELIGVLLIYFYSRTTLVKQ